MEQIDFQKRIEDSLIANQRGTVYRHVIQEIEKKLIEAALYKSGGNQLLSARILGLNRNTLRSKIRQLNIDIERFKE